MAQVFLLLNRYGKKFSSLAFRIRDLLYIVVGFLFFSGSRGLVFLFFPSWSSGKSSSKPGGKKKKKRRGLAERIQGAKSYQLHPNFIP